MRRFALPIIAATFVLSVGASAFADPSPFDGCYTVSDQKTGVGRLELTVTCAEPYHWAISKGWSTGSDCAWATRVVDLYGWYPQGAPGAQGQDEVPWPYGVTVQTFGKGRDEKRGGPKDCRNFEEAIPTSFPTDVPTLIPTDVPTEVPTPIFTSAGLSHQARTRAKHEKDSYTLSVWMSCCPFFGS